MSEDFTNLIEQSISKLQVKQGSIINATVVCFIKIIMLIIFKTFRITPVS